MYWKIIGDLAGSIYEYEQTKCIKSIEVNDIINEQSLFCDDDVEVLV